jgi:hypothetical protein
MGSWEQAVGHGFLVVEALARRKYKRLRTAKRFCKWWTGLLTRQPGLFTHWRLVRSYAG